MKRRLFFRTIFVSFFVVSFAKEPLSLHPTNPYYFIYQGKPTVLITSGEHYGVVLNLDFDFVSYLDALAAGGLNNTRVFTGVYVEHDQSHNIPNHTLAPNLGRFICPWSRNDKPEYANGGNKFDLKNRNPEYFERLKRFRTEAGDDYYRNEAWEFILAGGAIYNHLDYSFTVDAPDGTHIPANATPGGGSVALRQQIATLKRFIECFDFIRMAPDSDFVEGEEAYILAEPGKQYAVFLRNRQGDSLYLNLPKGKYVADWLDPVQGTTVEVPKFSHSGGIKAWQAPDSFTNGVALRIMSTKQANRRR